MVCCGSDERSMSGTELQRNDAVAPLNGTCLEQSYYKTCSEQYRTDSSRRTTQQNKLAPHRSPTTTVYSILLHPLLNLFYNFNTTIGLIMPELSFEAA